jgi:predicted RNase H-like HicB family nuclease
MTQYTIVYTTEEEGGFSGRCLELPGAISQGETLEELRSNMYEAIELVRESMAAEAKAEQRPKMIIEVQV